MKKLVLLGILLSISGLALILYAHFYAYEDNSNTIIQELKEASSNPSLPIRVISATAELDAAVSIGGFENNRWILSSKNALFLPTSKMPGDNGNTVLYAHKRKSLFGDLKNLDSGDTITIYNLDGAVYSYAVYEKEYIKPQQMDKIETGRENTLTLFTCDGWLDENRLVIKASLL